MFILSLRFLKSSQAREIGSSRGLDFSDSVVDGLRYSVSDSRFINSDFLSLEHFFRPRLLAIFFNSVAVNVSSNAESVITSGKGSGSK